MYFCIAMFAWLVLDLALTSLIDRVIAGWID